MENGTNSPITGELALCVSWVEGVSALVEHSRLYPLMTDVIDLTICFTVVVLESNEASGQPVGCGALLAQQPLIFFVGSNPEPDITDSDFYSQRPIVEVDSDRPEPTNFLK